MDENVSHTEEDDDETLQEEAARAKVGWDFSRSKTRAVRDTL